MTRQPSTTDPVDLVFPGTQDLDASAIFSGPGYQAPPIPTDSRAIAGLVCSLLFFIPILPLAGAGLGYLGLRRCADRRRNGSGLALAAIVIGSIVTALQLMVYLLVAVL